MALSSGLKSNHVMRCLDLNIPPGDEEFARMCRDILNTCIRNTEEAEKNAKAAASGESGTATSATGSSGKGSAKGLWNMIEESELAKSIRLDEERKVRAQQSSSIGLCVLIQVCSERGGHSRARTRLYHRAD